MWAIHNALRNWTLYGLNEREIQLLMNTLSSHEMKLISLCHLNEKKWLLFDAENHSQFVSSTGKAKNHFPEPVILASASADAEYFVIRPQKTILPRLHERIERELDVVIEGINKDQKFYSQTIDLSEGGIHFKDVIPDWVSGYFIVAIVYENQRFQIMCALVEDQKIRQRVQVMSEENDSHYLQYKHLLERMRLNEQA